MKKFTVSLVLGTALALLAVVDVERVLVGVGEYVGDAMAGVVALGPYFDHNG